MANELRGKVIALPSAHTSLGNKITDLLKEEENRLALGAPPAQFHALDVRIDGAEGAYCQPIELDRPSSINTFFHIAFAQLGKIDAVVFEALPLRGRRGTTERAIEIATRRLLLCLDAVQPYLGEELHFISINPVYGPAAIPIARTFLEAKLTATGKQTASRIRMSVLCPSPNSPSDEVSLSRSVVHVINEPQCPDIIEAILTPGRKSRGRQILPARRLGGKIDANLQ